MITVLLVDDHAVVRDGLRALLETNADIRVIGDAADGREAVQKARQQCPDVIVMDITMPELNGIDATPQTHQYCPDSQVVVLSIHATAEHIFRALQAGARGYLLKESAGKEVVQAVRAVHSGQRYLCQKVTEMLLDDYLRHGRKAGELSPLQRLSAREREVLQLVAEGKTSAEIAAILSLSPSTVETYRSRIMNKLDVKDLSGLVKFAIQHGLTPLE
jgi:DNA-binding NarL/FixJ family response regulator